VAEILMLLALDEHFPLAFSEYDRLRSWSWHLGGFLRVVRGDFTAVGPSINGKKLPLQCSRFEEGRIGAITAA
jgi:hypothetical protein